jgi:adenine C2-methylase RlmN of 23S rRNA A2503 and tRNA A37
MGMGEPPGQFRGRRAGDPRHELPDGLGVGARHHGFDGGHAPGIERLAALDLRSLASPSTPQTTGWRRPDAHRRKWPLERLMQACETHLASGGRMMTLEYVLLEDVNDSRRRRQVAGGPVFRAESTSFRTSPCRGSRSGRREGAVEIFRRRLEERRVQVTVRRSRAGTSWRLRASCRKDQGHGECAC